METVAEVDQHIGQVRTAQAKHVATKAKNIGLLEIAKRARNAGWRQ